ncbi:DUF6318 family protein [Kytococcus sedentarius]|nr:DUF6318 family protein [Kytococcus sedentarius]STX14368.1 Uncharacterised protein [Kytococcus sedentarius]
MNTTRHMLLTAALAGSLTLAACSDEAQDPPSPSSSGPAEESSPAGETSPSGSPSSEPTDTGPSEDPSPSVSPSDAGTSPSPSSPAPSGSGSATPSPSDGASPPSGDAASLPPMPPAAKENSEEGAEAFARWYVETLNHLWQQPQAGAIEQFSAPTCRQCANYEQTFREQEQSGEHQEGEAARIVGTHVAGGESPSTHEVIVVVSQPPARQVDASGEKIKDLPAIDGLGLRLNMHYAGGWRIDKIPTDPTAGEWVELDQ